MTENFPDEDQSGLTLPSLNFKNREPGYVVFRTAADVTYDGIWKIFGSIIHSNSEGFKSSDTLKVDSTCRLRTL